jgi:hypothetical protein
MNELVRSIDTLSAPEREQWVRSLASRLGGDFTYKFTKGQAEHGGDIGSVPLGKLLSEADSEVLDQLAYLAEIRRRVSSIDRLVARLIEVIMLLQNGLPVMADDISLIDSLVAGTDSPSTSIIEPINKKFKLGDSVKKSTKGSSWRGKVVGYYSTAVTPEGYYVESIFEKGSVHLYPVEVLEKY